MDVKCVSKIQKNVDGCGLDIEVDVDDPGLIGEEVHNRGHRVRIHQCENFDMKLEVAYGKKDTVDNDVVFFEGPTGNQDFCVNSDGTISPYQSSLVLGIHADGRLILTKSEDDARRLFSRTKVTLVTFSIASSNGVHSNMKGQRRSL